MDRSVCKMDWGNFLWKYVGEHMVGKTDSWSKGLCEFRLDKYFYGIDFAFICSDLWSDFIPISWDGKTGTFKVCSVDHNARKSCVRNTQYRLGYDDGSCFVSFVVHCCMERVVSDFQKEISISVLG